MKREQFVVIYLEGKLEIWEEFDKDTQAYKRARTLGPRVIKVVKRITHV